MRGVGLTAHDRDRISEAIRAAEANTCGEIYVVVARAVDDFRFVPVLWAAIAALILPWPLHLLTTLSSTTILLAQAMFFAVLASALSHPRLRHALVPRGIAAESSRKHAHALFFAHGVHLTEAIRLGRACPRGERRRARRSPWRRHRQRGAARRRLAGGALSAQA